MKSHGPGFAVTIDGHHDFAFARRQAERLAEIDPRRADFGQLVSDIVDPEFQTDRGGVTGLRI